MQFVSVHLTLFSTCGTPASDWAFFYSNPVSFLMLCFSLFCKLKKKKKPLLGNNWHKISCTYLKCTDVHTRIWAAITKHHRPAGIEQKCTVSVWRWDAHSPVLSAWVSSEACDGKSARERLSSSFWWHPRCLYMPSLCIYHIFRWYSSKNTSHTGLEAHPVPVRLLLS